MKQCNGNNTNNGKQYLRAVKNKWDYKYRVIWKEKNIYKTVIQQLYGRKIANNFSLYDFLVPSINTDIFAPTYIYLIHRRRHYINFLKNTLT